MQNLATRLLTQETVRGQDSASPDPAFSAAGAGRVLEQLRGHLSTRIGQEGYRMLLSRALTLTAARFPALKDVRVETDGSLVGLSEAADKDAEAAAALVGQILELLTTFIGADLTQRILSTVWPELVLGDGVDGETETL